jgi:cytochrome c-type biogenesis protein CcmH
VSPEADAPATARALSRQEVDAMAALSAEEREARIRSMVERLAVRLAQAPADAEGWRALARAYRVLGETDRARAAEARAAEAADPGQ